MTLDEFGAWLNEHPAEWHRIQSANDPGTTQMHPYPSVYRAFLNRFGPLVVHVNESFMSDSATTRYIQFMNGLAEVPGVETAGLVSFFHMGYGSVALCFAGDAVIDFDPMNGTTFVAASFEEFLGRYLESGFEQFWLQ